MKKIITNEKLFKIIDYCNECGIDATYSHRFKKDDEFCRVIIFGLRGSKLKPLDTETYLDLLKIHKEKNNVLELYEEKDGLTHKLYLIFLENILPFRGLIECAILSNSKDYTSENINTN